MRVTNNMMTDLVSFNMQRSLQRFLELQTQMSTGRRINKPSDDSLGILRDLEYREEINKNEQYLDTIGRARNWTDNYDTVLAELKDVVQTADEVAISMANDSYDDVSRAASANEIRSLLEQMIELSNSELEGKRVFSGFKTETEPFRVSARGAVYAGDTGQINYQLTSSNRTMVNLIGSDVFLKQITIIGEESDFNVAVGNTTPLAALHLGDGISQTPGTFQIVDNNLGLTAAIDLSGAGIVTVQDAIAEMNTQLTAAGMTNLTAALSATSTGITLDVDDTNPQRIGLVTPIAQLNQGRGIDGVFGRIRVTDGAAINVDVDLSSAATVGDIITQFNNAMTGAGVANVAMSLNGPPALGLRIDDTNGVPLGLRVEEVDPTSSMASDLRILGSLDAGGVLVGGNLDPKQSFTVNEVGLSSTAGDLGILSSFSTDLIGQDLNPEMRLVDSLSALNGGIGFTLGSITMHQGDQTVTLNLGNPAFTTVQDLIDEINNSGLNVTASINPDGSGLQIVNNDPNRTFSIDDGGPGGTARTLGMFGASDMVSTMMLLTEALERDDREGVELLLGNFQNAIQHLLNYRATIGARGVSLDGIENRLNDQSLVFTERLSEVEDADITEVITQLATYENNYQAALMAGARLIQPSLMDFLS